MSISLIIFIGLAVLQFIIDHNKKNSEQEKPKKIKKNKQGVLVKSNTINNSSKQTEETNIEYKPIRNEIRKRKIVDREKEIINTNYYMSSDKIVEDIIYSEILKKPKSRRR